MIYKLRLSLDSTSSEILLGHGLLADVDRLLDARRNSKLVLVTDEHVSGLYARTLYDRLVDAGYQASILKMPCGEDGKTLSTLKQLYDQCLDLGVEREDTIVAVGGGVVGDVAGMLAATYLRGLCFVQIPTTLVAMLTASVGGKVGINLRSYKNLIGAFKQPDLVLADLNCLETLPEVEYRSGLGELITVGVLGCPDIFTALEQQVAPDLAPLVAAAIQCKIDIVEKDPYEQFGLRSHLNLGHTFGHALERLTDFQLAHGLAVGIGLHMASNLAAAANLCAAELPSRIASTLRLHQLPTTATSICPTKVIDVMRRDKKAKQGKLRFVLPRDIGHVELVDEHQLPPGLVTRVLQSQVKKGTQLFY